MNHDEALREMATERYLLGELENDARDAYEEHLFSCERCAADLRSAQTFVDGARIELCSMPLKEEHRPASWLSRFASPWLLGPALAACLLLLAVQFLVLRPRLEQQVAEAQTPAFLSSLALAGGSARGTKTVEVVAPKNGAFLLEVDIPAETRFSGYRCVLYAPTGDEFWTGDLSQDQAQDTVSLRVPVARTAAGVNVLVVEGVVKATGEEIVLARHPFELTIHDKG